MPLLDAALAFALTMLLVSTAVTFVVGAVNALASARFRILELFLDRFYRFELVPTVEAELRRLASRVEPAERPRVAAAATELATWLAQYGGLPPRAGDEATNVNEIRVFKLQSVPRSEMMHRLRTSRFGLEVLELGDAGEEILRALGDRFDTAGRRVSERFRDRARLISTWVGIVMAFGLNIDSLHLLSTYIDDDAARAAAIARADATLEQHGAALAAAETDGSPESARAALEATRTELRRLRGSGLPLGWALYPYCGDPSLDRRCDGPIRPAPLITWLLGCLLCGLLAGLGAPFWYDAVRRVTNAATGRAEPPPPPPPPPPAAAR
ncbi:MAG: hypothetical protein H6744_19955 [Deltaproteobacteria bacterium]|nr:hypothetical protein [Deltaproteobacteria bacterium]MCB9788958.1 hypothetical protein [Deltaproteobacteria bacterium]